MYLDLSARQKTTQNAESGIASKSPKSEWKTAPQKKKLKMTPAYPSPVFPPCTFGVIS